MSKKSRVWDIKRPSLRWVRLCVQIFCSCTHVLDVTRPPGSMALKKLTTDALFYQQADAFNRSAATEEEVVLAGEKALLCVYNCKSPVESLDTLRCTGFCQQVATETTFVQPESLPPTSAAAAYHSQRVYFQIQQWKGMPLQPEDWGWKLTVGKLLPVRRDLPPLHMRSFWKL